MLARTVVTTVVRTALLAMAVVAPHASAAQSSPDSTTTASEWPSHFAAWGSVGLGTNISRAPQDGDIAGVVRGSVSIGRWLVMYRGSDVGPFMGGGSGVRDAGVLAGMRTNGHRAFGSAALGYARANPYHQSENSGYPTLSPSVGVLAYDVALHANEYVPGIALSMSGVVGPSKATYTAVTLCLELGWFGR